MGTFKQAVEKILKQEKTFLDTETKELSYTKVKDSADKIDPNLIALLAGHKETKEKFFTKIKDVYVFNINDFKFFLDENKINNSYTQFANQIGLSDGPEFLKDRGEVVLGFPYKDCVLEGGQSTEEGMDEYFEWSEKSKKYEEKTAKRSEVFFNQVLARDEIDRLFDKKALVNWKRHTKDSGKDGVAVKDIERDENGTIKENFVIKGNNLLALHSLKVEFAGKVKLIYIDPPFNTGKDTFVYNDKFTRSTWLTFMKNRLEVAKDLLTDDGNIFIHIDINQSHYLKVLCDAVFDESNFVEELIWSYGSPSGGRASGAKPVNIHDYILHYTKNYQRRKQNKIYIPYSEKYIEDWFKYTDGDGRRYRRRMRGYDNNGKAQWEKQYLDESKGIPLSTVWNDIKQVYADPRAYKENQSQHTELKKEFTGGQKPEALIKRLIEMTTDEGDYVLDYHAGTGTTLSVAHKMNRHWIGIEQMDYIHDLPEARLKEVVKGEQAGISKLVKWKGGGSFIYCELAKWNEQAKEEINEAKDHKALEKMFDMLYEKYFFNYNVKIKEFKEKVLKEENFKKITLDEQKRMFLTMLDLNQMYVQESEMGDKRFGISKDDQKLTKEFYSK
ncbi:MAG: site-specific DNA-methyltransferase [Candidatus Paceibacterota bacterium]|jgi:adenine-specific DNA-methyltransferase